VALEPPHYLQNLAGGYSARLDRLLISSLFRNRERVLSGFVVMQRVAGANTSVDVTAGEALIQGDNVDRQGLYLAMSTAATFTAGSENVVAPVKPGTNSRIDLFGLRVRDAQAIGSGTDNDVIFDWVQGTAAASPAVPATPASFLVLARVLRTAAEVSILAASITDVAVRSPYPYGSGDAPPTGNGAPGDIYVEW